MNNPATIVPGERTLCMDTHVWDLRALASLVLPDGLARIEDFWFADADVRSATIPRSVKEIGKEAFLRCKKLQKVGFVKEGLLERLGERCFQESGLQELRTPQSLREIASGAFAKCKGLKKVDLNAGLRVLAEDAFAKTRFEGMYL